MKNYKIFAINPGSTSTKIAMFENSSLVFAETVAHSSQELEQFATVAGQFDYRRQTILNALAGRGETLRDTDCFAARCSGVYPCAGGIYHVTDKVLEDCFSGYTVHPAILGGKLADSLAKEFGGMAIFMNPPDTDEFQDVARITGFHDIYRTSNLHMLNQKETALRAAAELGKKYEDCRFVIAHIGGGVSVTAHLHGRAVDSTSIIMGEGPFTPTRAGALPLVFFMDMCYSGQWTRDEMYEKLIQSGGFIDHLGTNSILEVEQMISDGDEYAKLVMDAFIYQIGKCVGSMIAVLHGKADAILLCGGIVHSQRVVDGITAMCGYAAPIRIYPGEFEMEALASGAMRALTGQDEIKTYTGIPVFTGFARDPEKYNKGVTSI